MFAHRRGISLFGTNAPSCGISLSGINYGAGSGGGTLNTFDKYSDEYMKIKIFIQENFMTPLIRKDMDFIKLNAFNFDYLLKKLNNYALMFKDTGIFINLIESIKAAIEITDENEKLYQIVYGNSKDTTLLFRTTAVEFKPEYQIFIQLYGEPTSFEEFDNDKLSEIKNILITYPALTYNELKTKLGIVDVKEEKEEKKPEITWEDMPDDPSERRRIRAERRRT
jgi:hypothetical protein